MSHEKVVKNTNLFWGDQPPQSLVLSALWGSEDGASPTLEVCSLLEAKDAWAGCILPPSCIFSMCKLGQNQYQLVSQCCRSA